MSLFDEELWRRRAWIRYLKVCAAKPTASRLKSASKRWSRDVASIKHLKTLVQWCSDKAIQVVFCQKRGGVYYPDAKKIKINGRLSPEMQVFFMLHECGHHLIGDKEKHERFGMGYSQLDPNIKRTLQHRCDVVDEEFEAWQRGWKLSERLKMKIDKEHYDKTRSRMIMSYFKWALRVDGYGKDDDDEEVVA